MRKLLVADDSLTIQKVIRLALSTEGYEIQAVSDGKDACQQIALFQPDVVLIDIALPELDAFQVKDKFDQEAEGQKTRFVLMYSAYEQLNEEDITKRKFNGRLVKPFDPSHLRRVISDVLNIGDTAKPPKMSGKKESTLPNLDSDHWQDEREEKSKGANPAKQKRSLLKKTEDAELQQLTEDTINMSGLNDFEWDVNEPAKTSAKASPPEKAPDKTKVRHIPTPPPPPKGRGKQEVGEVTALRNFEPTMEPKPNMFDTDGIEFNFENISENIRDTTVENGSERIEAVDSLSDPPNLAPDPPEASDPGDEFSVSPLSALPEDHVSGSNQELIREESDSVIPLSTDQMESIIRKQLEATLEKVTRELLPEIAESVIKKEIHKMLSNPPN